MRSRSGLLAVMAVIAGGAAAAGSPRAALVFRGGQVYTVDAARTWATAVAIQDGRIAYVGDDRGAVAFAGRGARVVELEGRMVLPGFHDSHMHPVTGGLRLIRCRLDGATSVEQLAATVRACAAASPGTPWLVGNGWEPKLFPGGGPTVALLDELVPDRPAYLATADGFTAWVNSRALRLAGIDGKTPGALRGEAVGLLRRKIPPASAAEYREGLRRALAMANRSGITSLIDASADLSVLEQYLAADRAGELTARVLASQRIDLARGVEQVAELVARRERYRSGRLRADSAKIVLDGEFESFTAALLQPYAARPESRGALHAEPDALAALVRRLDAEGFQVHAHVIGDRAVRVALDAFAAARAANGPGDRRHQLAHVELIDPEDVPRFRRLGVAANIQPLLGLGGGSLDGVAPLLGPERARHLFPYPGLFSSGAVVVAGSDWPAPSMNPLEIMRAALLGRPVRLAELIAAYTIGGAWIAGAEARTGSIEVGKAADLVVLDRNLFDVPPAELARVRVLLTLLEGRAVHRDPGFALPE